MEKNFVFSNFGIAPHSATPDFFQNLLKTAKAANMEKHLFSKFWDTPQSASIVFRIFAEYATSSKNGKTFGFVPFGTAPHCATFFSWEFIENSKSSKHEKNTLPFGTRMKPQGMRQDKKKSDSIRTLQSTLERLLEFLAVFLVAPVQLLLLLVVSSFQGVGLLHCFNSCQHKSFFRPQWIVVSS